MQAYDCEKQASSEPLGPGIVKWILDAWVKGGVGCCGKECDLSAILYQCFEREVEKS